MPVAAAVNRKALATVALNSKGAAAVAALLVAAEMRSQPKLLVTAPQRRDAAAAVLVAVAAAVVNILNRSRRAMARPNSKVTVHPYNRAMDRRKNRRTVLLRRRHKVTDRLLSRKDTDHPSSSEDTDHRSSSRDTDRRSNRVTVHRSKVAALILVQGAALPSSKDAAAAAVLLQDALRVKRRPKPSRAKARAAVAAAANNRPGAVDRARRLLPLATVTTNVSSSSSSKASLAARVVSIAAQIAVVNRVVADRVRLA